MTIESLFFVLIPTNEIDLFRRDAIIHWKYDFHTDLEEVKGPGLAPVPGEGRGAGGVDAVNPVVQLNLTRGLKYRNCKYNTKYILGFVCPSMSLRSYKVH